MYNTLATDLINAIKTQDTAKLSTLRCLKSSLTNYAIDKRVSVDRLADIDVTAIIRKEIKKCQDAADGFKLGNRLDSMKIELDNIKVLSSYLPAELSANALDQLITTSIAEAQATSKKQMGLAMKIAIHKSKGQVSTQVLSTEIGKRLK